MAQTKEMAVVLSFDDQGSVQIKRVLKDLDGDLNKVKETTNETGKGFDKLRDNVDNSGKAFDKMKNSVKSSILQVAAGIGIWTSASAVMGFVTKSMRDVVEQGKAFEEAFSKIRVTTGGNVEENERLRQAIMRMNPALGSATELTKALAIAMTEFSEASRPEQLAFVETAAKVAVAGFTDTKTAVDALTAVVKGYRMELGDAAKVGEVLVKATQIENVSFGEMGNSLARLSNTAKLAGVSFSELVGSYLTLAERQTPQLAMMQLRMLLNSLMKTSGPAATEAKRLGIEWSAAGIKAMGFVNWLKKLNQVTAGSAEVLDNLIPGGRQMIGMLSLIGNNAKETAEKVQILTKAFDDGGAVQAAFLERMRSASFLIDTAKEMFSRFKIAIFQGFSQPLLEGISNQKDFDKKLSELTNKAVDFGNKVGKTIYGVIGAVAKLVGALAPLLKVWAALFVATKISTFFSIAMGGFGGLIPLVGSLVGKILALIATGGPLLIVVGGLTIIAKKLWDAKEAIDAAAEAANDYDKANVKLQNRLYEMVTAGRMNINTFYELQDKYKGNAVAMAMAIKKGYEGADAQKAFNDVLVHGVENVKNRITYGVAMAKVMSGEALTAEEAAGSIEGLTEEQRDNIVNSNKAREEMRKYGFTFKTELQDRYDALKLGIKTFRQQMTPEDFKKLNEELKKLGATLGYNNKALVDLNILTKTETDAEVKILTGRFTELKTASDAGIITWANYKIGIDAVNASLKALGSTTSVTINGIQKLVETPLPKGRDVSGLMAMAPGMFTEEQMNDPNVRWPKKMPVGKYYGNQSQEEAADLLGIKTTKKLRYEVELLEEAYRTLKDENNISKREEISAINTIIELYKKLGIKVPKEYQKILDAAQKVGKGIGVMASLLSGVLASAGETQHQKAENLRASITDDMSWVEQQVIQTKINIADAWGNLWDVLGEGLSGFSSKIQENMKAGMTAMQAVGQAALAVATELAGKLGAALGGVIAGGKKNYGAEGAGVGGAIGSIFGPVGGIIGSLAGGLFGGLFKKKKTAEEKAAEALKKSIDAVVSSYSVFGKISQETAKKIVEMTKSTNKATASILTLTDVMNDAGISTKNLSNYFQKMRQALSDIKAGTVDAQKGIAALGSAFNQLVGWAQSVGQEGNKQIVGFIKYLRKLGVQIKEVQDYVFSQLSMGAAGVTAMINGVGGANYDLLLSYSEQIKTLGTEIENADKSRITDRSAQLALQQQKDQLDDLNQKYKELKGTLATELAPELDRVARLTLATFNSFIAQGAGYTDAFAAIKEPLTMLRDKYRELGIEGNAAINDLMKILDVTEASKGLMEALDGNRQVLEALGNTGFLTAENMQDVATSAQSFYDKLIAGGATAQQSLAMISPTLADLEYYSKQYGFALDDNTKRLIDEAKQAGTYRERGKDVVTTLNEGFLSVTDRLDRMLRYYEEGARGGKAYADEYAEGGGGGGGRPRETGVATGFHGTVTGPRRFYVEPGVTERVDIGSGGGQQKVVVVDKQITLEPVVIQLKELEAIIIKYVQKATSDERLIISPKSVRSGG